MSDLRKIKGILCDIAGTIEFRKKPIPGAIETYKKLKSQGYKFIFLTNTDSRTPKDMFRILNSYGFPVSQNDIFTPVIAVKRYLEKFPEKKTYFLCTHEVKQEFKDFHQPSNQENADFVLISDFSDDWRVEHLNQAFQYVYNGAKLLGTQGNRYFLDGQGEANIDTGSFVKMIGDAAGAIPYILGKPNPEYFHSARKILKLLPEETLIIGDDIESDIKGGINAGMSTILVRTGKGSSYYPSNYSFQPTAILNDFTELETILTN